MASTSARSLALRFFVAPLGVVAVSFGAPIFLSAQAPQHAPVFRSATQIVRVDAVVVDKDGKPVRGLTKDDFEILDKKTLRPVETLEELAYDRSPSTLGGPLPARLWAADNHDAANDRRVILVIDEPRVMMSRTSQARDAAKRIVNALGGRAEVALLRTNGELACEFTKDTRLLLDTIDDVDGEKTYFTYSGLGLGSATSVASMYDIGAVSNNFLMSRPMPPNLRDRGVYRVLGDATRTLSYDNARRTAVVLVSEGQPIVPVPVEEFGHRLNAAWERDRRDLEWMVTSARNANVAVYAIDPRGKGRPGEEGYANQWMVGFHDDIATLAQGALREVTAMTGGFAFTGSDDFAAGANRILDELDHYYLLGFSPADPSDTSPRQITVRVKRPGLTVRHRQYFSSAAPKVPKFPKNPTTKDWLQSLVAEVTPRAGVPVRVSASIANSAGKGDARVTIRGEATAPAGDALDLGLWVIDITHEKVSKQADLPLFFSAATSTHELMLAPGRYQIRLAARAQRSGRGGSAYLMLDVPK
jgi:VWFA-related protein